MNAASVWVSSKEDKVDGIKPYLTEPTRDRDIGMEKTMSLLLEKEA